MFLFSAPCAVQSVLSTLNCSANALTVSWEAGPVPVRYNATAVDAGGTALSCTTEGTSCTIASLNCGRRYTVTVRATGITCEGHGSVPETVNSGGSVGFYKGCPLFLTFVGGGKHCLIKCFAVSLVSLLDASILFQSLVLPSTSRALWNAPPTC